MRLPRMTTRRWMVAVAISALVIAASLWVSRRCDEPRSIAGSPYSTSPSGICASAKPVSIDTPTTRASDRRDRDELQMLEAHQLKLAKYHYDMARKYEHAARYPWLPVEPDPPEPR